MTLQIYGLYRSGTNYLAWLVENNLDARIRHGTEGNTWKHGPPHVTNADGYLLVTKDPLAWLASRQRYRPAPVDELCREYNTRGWEFVRFSDRPDTLMVRYEDLLTRLDYELERIWQKFGLEKNLDPSGPLDDWPADVVKVMNRGGDGGLITIEEYFDRSYYAEKRYLSDVPEGYDFDDELLKRLGYA